MILTANKKAQAAFITRSQLKLKGPRQLKGPLTASPIIKSDTAGAGGFAWRMDGDKDFLPANRIAFKVSAESDWQTQEVALPPTARSSTCVSISLSAAHRFKSSNSKMRQV